jgi:hypothetical protein
MYGEDQYLYFRQQTRGGGRTQFEDLLKTTYKEEAGDNANIVVKRLKLKDKDDLAGVFKGGAYDVIIYNGHGGSKKKEIYPGGNVALTPEDIHDALAEAKITPSKIYLYGCNTAESGFARVLSELEPKTAVTGAGNRIAQEVKWNVTQRGERINFSVLEDRDHNITYNKGKETLNVRKVDPETLKNASLPRP